MKGGRFEVIELKVPHSSDTLTVPIGTLLGVMYQELTLEQQERVIGRLAGNALDQGPF